MNYAYLSTGGNIGDVRSYMQQALTSLQQSVGELVAKSAFYETAPWGKTDQPAFLNQVLLIKTLLKPIDLVTATLNIEVEMGRKRTVKYGPRTVDIDILFYNEDIINLEQLIIPHPQLQYRRFVLVPLHEIAPDFVHPVLQQSIAELLQNCSDPLTVTRIE